jgi:type IV pilus assembly protein PilA
MLMVIAVIAILALLALPSFQDKIVRDQILEAAHLADLAKAPVAAEWSAKHTLPADNAAAGLPAANKIVGNFVQGVAVESGAVQLRFGNSANSALKGKTLTWRPAVVDDAPVVPVAWVCGRASAPDKMTLKGLDKTDIPERFLPMNYRKR